MTDRKFTITKGSDLNPSRAADRKKAEADLKTAEARLKKAQSDQKVGEAELTGLMARRDAAVRKSSAVETAAADQSVKNSARKKEAQESLDAATRDGLQKIEDLQGRIVALDKELDSNLKKQSPERLKALRSQRDLYRELAVATRDVSGNSQNEMQAILQLEKQITSTERSLNRHSRAVKEVATGTDVATESIKKSATVTKAASKSVDDHVAALEKETTAVQKVGEAHDATNVKRRGGAGGAPPPPPPPPGGGGPPNDPPGGGGGPPEDPLNKWDKFFRDRIEKSQAELDHELAPVARQKGRDVKTLDRRETFAEGAARLKELRDGAERLFASFNTATKQIIDTDELKKANRSLGQLQAAITKASRALSEGTGDAEGLGRSLRNLIEDTSGLAKATSELNDAEVISYNQAKQRLVLARNIAQTELRRGVDGKSKEQLQRVVDRADAALGKADSAFAGDGTIDVGKTVSQFEELAALTREQVTNSKEVNRLTAERKIQIDAEVAKIEQLLRNDERLLETARKNVATARDQKVIDEQLAIVRGRIAALDRAKELGGINRQPILEGFQYDAARSWRDTSEAILDARRNSADYEKQVQDTSDTIKKFTATLENQRMAFYKAGLSDHDIDSLRGRLAKYELELRKMAHAGRDISGLRGDINDFGETLMGARANLNKFDMAIERLSNRFGFLRRALQGAESTGRRFSLFTTVATLALEPLLSTILGVGSSLLSLASSALGAGVALGGAFVAGVAQALPAIGLLAFAFKGLLNVIRISSLSQKDSVTNLARDARGIGGASAATDQLTSSTEQLTTAQTRLSDARQQAIRDLEDLADKERSAELASRQATLSVVEAEIALRDAQQNGSVLDVQRAQMALDASKIGQRQANRDTNRVGVDATRTRNQGVGGNEQVVSARQALAQAERSLASARNQGAAAATGLTQATAVLDEQIARLTPTQRVLLESINNLRDAFRKGPFADIRDIMLKPFIGAIDSISKLAKNSKILQSFFGLAASISDVLGDALNSITGKGGQGLFLFLNGEAAKNIGIIGEAVGSLASVFGKLIRGASPLLTWVLEGIAETWSDIDRSFSNSGLVKFFNNQKPAYKAVASTLEQTFIWLKNIFELSSPAGNSMLNTFASWLKDINTELASPAKRREMKKFFEDMGKGFGDFAGALRDISHALFSNLDTTSLSTLARVMSEVLAPAMGSLVKVSGTVSRALGLILDIPFASEIGAMALALTIFSKTWVTISGIMAGARTALMLTTSKLFDMSGAVTGLSGTGMVGFSGGMKDAGEKSGKLAGRAAKAAEGVKGLGKVLGNIGGIGIIAAIGLTAFADPLAELADKLNLLTTRADRARDALNRLGDAQAVQKDRSLGVRFAENDLATSKTAQSQAEADVDGIKKRIGNAAEDMANAQSEKERRKAAKRKLAAMAELTAAELDLERANNAFDSAAARLDQARSDAVIADVALSDARKKTAENIAALVAAGKIKPARKTSAKGVGGDQDGTPVSIADQAKALAKQLGLSDEAFAKLGKDSQENIAQAIQGLVSGGGEADVKTIEFIIKAVLDGKSVEDIYKEIGKNQPEFKAKVALDQTAFRMTLEDLSRLDRKMNGIIGSTTKLGFFSVQGHRMDGLFGGDPRGDYAIPHAAGGIVKATNGGQKILAGEKGYDEFIISTDPTKRGRSIDLLGSAARRLALPFGEGDPPSLASKGRGVAQRSTRAPLETFFSMFRKARALDGLDIPYSWGGGHVSPARPTRGVNADGKDGSDTVGLDCSSSVSSVLQSGMPGFPTITSGQFPGQSQMQSGRGLVTVWSNKGHVFMQFGEQDWGTGGGNPAGGPGFNSHSKSGFTASHPLNLGPKANDKSAFGEIYSSLVGAGIGQITSIGDRLHGLGDKARTAGDNFTGSLNLKSVLGNGLAPGINAGMGKFLSQFKGFRAGGYTPGGSQSQPYTTVVHGGEGIIDAGSMGDIRSGKTGKDVTKEIVGSIVGAIKDGVKQAIGYLKTDASSLTKASQNRLPDFDLNGKKKAGGVFKVVGVLERLEAAIDKDGKFNDLTGALKRFADLTPKKFATMVTAMRDKVWGILAKIESDISLLTGAIEKKNQKVASDLTSKIEGTYNEVTKTFTAGSSSSAVTGGDSAGAEAKVNSLIEQRGNLVGQRSEINKAIAGNSTTRAGLKKDKTRLEKVLAALRKDLGATKNPAKKKQIRQEITKAEAALKSINEQLSALDTADKNLNSSLDSTNSSIQSTDSEIGAAQGARVDALMSEATSGDLSSSAANAKLDEAARLAAASGDTQRGRAIIRARAQVATSGADSRGALSAAQAKSSMFFQGATSGNTALAGALDAIVKVNQDKRTALQVEKDALIAAGVDANSDAVLALTAQITELDVTIAESTKAIYDARLQNVDARMGLAQSQLRGAELAGNTDAATAARRVIGTLLEERISTLTEEMARLTEMGLGPNSIEMINLTTMLQDANNALTENTNAINGTTNQNFTTTSFQLFRKAIFDGNGALLQGLTNAIAADPTYTVSAMASGGSIMSDGLIYAHKGEQVIPASISRDYGSSSHQNIDVTINEAQQTVDPLYLAKRLAFELAGR